jgi:hypothetical protein
MHEFGDCELCFVGPSGGWEKLLQTAIHLSPDVVVSLDAGSGEGWAKTLNVRYCFWEVTVVTVRGGSTVPAVEILVCREGVRYRLEHVLACRPRWPGKVFSKEGPALPLV